MQTLRFLLLAISILFFVQTAFAQTEECVQGSERSEMRVEENIFVFGYFRINSEYKVPQKCAKLGDRAYWISNGEAQDHRYLVYGKSDVLAGEFTKISGALSLASSLDNADPIPEDNIDWKLYSTETPVN